VQLYSESNEPLEQFLQAAGATVRAVQPYVYAPAADTERVAALIQQLDRGTVDVLIFTSSPQLDRLLDVARERGLEAALRQGLQRTRVAAVGPVLGQHLHEHGIRVDIQPAQGFVMKNLVQQIKRQLASAPEA
jgi:uroporphyrinogen-III synthase